MSAKLKRRSVLPMSIWHSSFRAGSDDTEADPVCGDGPGLRVAHKKKKLEREASEKRSTRVVFHEEMAEMASRPR